MNCHNFNFFLNLRIIYHAIIMISQNILLCCANVLKKNWAVFITDCMHTLRTVCIFKPLEYSP